MNGLAIGVLLWSSASFLAASVTTLTISNQEFSAGVAFCRGPEIVDVFTDAGLTTPAAGSSLDCSKNTSTAALKWGQGAPGQVTLAIGLEQGASLTLYMADEGTWSAGSCWYQDVTSNAKVSLASGPQYQSQVEFTILADGKGPVSFDLTSVEGVSGGIQMSYVDISGNAVNASAMPNKPDGIAPMEAPGGVGFMTVLADKHRQKFLSCNCTTFSPNDPECNTDACYAGCPAALVNDVCGQHRCRSFYASLYANQSSYCAWLYSSGAQTYCWAMDEWQCTDSSCGYGGSDEPATDCSSKMPDGVSANTYSCGYTAGLPSLPSGDGSAWWTNGGGCFDKTVNGVKTNPEPTRHGGQIQIVFANLPWLHDSDHQHIIV